MKIFNFGLDIEPGKYKYKNECFDKLVAKFAPQKETYYTVEFLDGDLEKCDAVAFNSAKKLDLVLIDLEKIENRILRCEDVEEKNTLRKAQELLEKEMLLCDSDLPEQARNVFRQLQLVTNKPCLGLDKVENVNDLISALIDKSGILLFFTAGKKEVRIWDIKKGESILEAAGRIHSDLKRGFIKAEVTRAADLDKFFNMAEARSKGLVQVVDKDYIMQENDIIEIRFSV